MTPPEPTLYVPHGPDCCEVEVPAGETLDAPERDAEKERVAAAVADLRAEYDTLRAREDAELRAEVETLHEEVHAGNQRGDAADAELRDALATVRWQDARLAAVLALCDRWEKEADDRGDEDRLHTRGVAAMVRAAATGKPRP